MLGSFLLHALVIGLLIGWGLPYELNEPPSAPPIPVLVIAEGTGAAGAAGGSGGGADQKAASATPPSSAASQTAADTPRPSPPRMVAPPPPDSEAPARLVAKPRPRPQPKPRAEPAAVPAPPTPAPPTRLSEATHEAPAPTAAAPVAAPASASASAATPGTRGAGAGPGGDAGRGSGAAGAGRGAVGDGDLDAPGDDYLDRVRRWVNRFKKYPSESVRRKEEGQALVRFVFARDGTVLDAAIERSSGHPMLDQATLEMIRAASPLPPPPDRYKGNELRLAVPIAYRLGFFERLF